MSQSTSTGNKGIQYMNRDPRYIRPGPRPVSTSDESDDDDSSQKTSVDICSDTCGYCNRKFKNSKGVKFHQKFCPILKSSQKSSEISGTSETTSNDKNAKQKETCKGCGRSFVCLNQHLARGSGRCAELRVQNLINSTSGLCHQISSSNDTPSNVSQTEKFQTSTTDEKEEIVKTLVKEADDFANAFEPLLSVPFSDDNRVELETVMSNFVSFLFKANSHLPGPIHPTVAYFRKRQENKSIIADKGYSKSTNPQRSSQRRKKRLSDKYKYDLAQWQYSNQRKKVARTILNATKTVQMKRNLCDIESHFKSIYENPNDKVRENYEIRPVSEDDDDDDNNEFHITLERLNFRTVKI